MLRNLAIAQGSGVGIGEGTAGDMQGDTLKGASWDSSIFPGLLFQKPGTKGLVVLRFTVLTVFQAGG